MSDAFDENLVFQTILEGFRVSYETGCLHALAFIRARVKTQNSLSDSEVMADIRRVFSAYDKADRQWVKAMKEELKCLN